VLNPADGPRIAAIGLAKATAAAHEPDLACFPKVPGSTATGTMTRVPDGSDLTKPLPVTCQTEIEPLAIGLWKMTLTESWSAASDRSTGSLVLIQWLAADGTPDGGASASTASIPYLP
jgi:hypothetical protein